MKRTYNALTHGFVEPLPAQGHWTRPLFTEGSKIFDLENKNDLSLLMNLLPYDDYDNYKTIIKLLKDIFGTDPTHSYPRVSGELNIGCSLLNVNCNEFSIGQIYFNRGWSSAPHSFANPIMGIGTPTEQTPMLFGGFFLDTLIELLEEYKIFTQTEVSPENQNIFAVLYETYYHNALRGNDKTGWSPEQIITNTVQIAETRHTDRNKFAFVNEGFDAQMVKSLEDAPYEWIRSLLVAS